MSDVTKITTSTIRPKDLSEKIVNATTKASQIFNTNGKEEIEILPLAKETTGVERLENFYSQHQTKNHVNYGVNQGAFKELCQYIYHGKHYSYDEATELIQNAVEQKKSIPHFTRIENAEYKRLKGKLITQGFSAHDADVILNMIDTTGICSYAAVANEIYTQFKDQPEKFEKIFGYPMFKLNRSQTTEILNSEELLLDLYIYMNSEENGGVLFKNHKINKSCLLDEVDVLGSKTLDTSEQVFLSSSKIGNNNQLINKFLKSKDPSLSYHSEKIVDKVKQNQDSRFLFGDVKKALDSFNFDVIEDMINSGNAISLHFYYNPSTKDKPIRLISCDKESYSDFSTSSWTEGSGHAVAVTGITNDSIIVSSWGRKYEIPKSDLNGSRYQFIMSNITSK